MPVTSVSTIQPHNVKALQTALRNNGFAITDVIYSAEETAVILQAINLAAAGNPSLKKTESLFAIRRFFHQVPQAAPLLFNTALVQLIRHLP